MTLISGCFSSTRTISNSASWLYTLPVGLLGVQSTSRRVRGVMAASNCSAVRQKLFSIVVRTSTLLPSANFTIST